MERMMLLYDSPSPTPNPRRVRIYLAEKGMAVPTRSLSVMAGEHKSADFVAKYPPGQLPVLELDDGRMIGETVAICRYFETLHPDPPMFGAGAVGIAEVEMWIRRVELNFGAAIRNIWIHTHPLTARVVKHQYTDFGESNRPLAEAAMRTFDAALANSPFLAGTDYSMADISLLSTIDFAAFIGVPISDDTPSLKAWHTRVSARPSASA
jgi:glutathione S-transferase